MSRSGIMLCAPFEEKRLLKWEPPYITQPKLDGDRCRAIIDDSGNVTLLSSEENIFDHVPHINAALEKTGLRNVELDGELYRHGMLHQDIHSIVSRKVNIHSDFLDIEYHIFDVVSDMYQASRSVWLREYISQHCVPDTPLCLVSYDIAHSVEGVMSLLEDYIKMGYEGIIVRNPWGSYVRKRSVDIMKYKPRKDDYYLIINSVEEISIHGEPKNALGAIVCKGDDGTVFRVGSGPMLTREQRQRLWQERAALPGKLLHVKYQHLTKDKVPRFPIAVEVVDIEKGDVW
jgi:ATP-dependent DNA ligase